VTIPTLTPGIEERNNTTRFSINSGQVRALMKIAMIAGQSEIVGIVLSTMLTGNDVLDVKGEHRESGRRQVAILTTIAGALADQRSQSTVHLATWRFR
jgi:hypothetical protein